MKSATVFVVAVAQHHTNSPQNKLDDRFAPRPEHLQELMLTSQRTIAKSPIRPSVVKSTSPDDDFTTTVFTSLLLESSSTPIDWNSGRQVIGKIAENVGEAVKNTVAGVKNIVNDVTDNVEDILDIILKKVAIDIKFLTQVIGKLLGGVEVDLKNLFEKLATLEGEAKEKVEIALGKVQTAALKVEGLITQIVTAAKAGAVQEVEKLKEEVSAAEIEFKEAVEELSAISEKLLGEDGADVAALLATIKSVVAKLVKDVETAISKVLDFIGAFLGVRDEALQKLVYEKIQISEEAVDKLIAAVKEALTKLTGTTEKEALSKILEKCLSFEITVDNAHVALKSGVDTGNNVALVALAISLEKIIAKTGVDLDEDIKTLQEVQKNANQSDAKTMTKAMADIKVNVQLVRGNAKIVYKAIVEVLAKRGSSAN